MPSTFPRVFQQVDVARCLKGLWITREELNDPLFADQFFRQSLGILGEADNRGWTKLTFHCFGYVALPNVILSFAIRVAHGSLGVVEGLAGAVERLIHSHRTRVFFAFL